MAKTKEEITRDFEKNKQKLISLNEELNTYRKKGLAKVDRAREELSNDVREGRIDEDGEMIVRSELNKVQSTFEDSLAEQQLKVKQKMQSNEDDYHSQLRRLER